MILISIHALLAESDNEDRYGQQYWRISIHALLAESDHYDNYNLHCTEISIHALLAESDSRTETIAAEIGHFYPRSPCGERLNTFSKKGQANNISIHALLAESDTWQRGSGITYVISIHALLAESD